MIKNKNLNKDNTIIKNDFNRLSQNIRYDMEINNEFDNNNILKINQKTKITFILIQKIYLKIKKLKMSISKME